MFDLDRLLWKLGIRTKKVSVQGIPIWVRRCEADKRAVRNTLPLELPGLDIGSTDIVVEIGGHAGCATVRAARRAQQGQVIVYEPVAEMHQLLTENLRRNEITNTKTRRLAVHGSRGDKNVYLDEAHSGRHSISTRPVGEVFEVVESITIEDVVEQEKLRRIDLLILDCCGSETTILTSAPKSVLKRIRKILIRFQDSPSVPDCALDDYLSKFGFHKLRLLPDADNSLSLAAYVKESDAS